MDNLPSSGPERSIFIRALREYSDQCEPPELTPSCPYYQFDRGGAWCGEECMDLLAQFPDESSESGSALVDDFFARPRRRRARRSPASSARPFDAREMYIEDRSRPITQWRASSLILCLQEQVLPPPPSLVGGSRTERAPDLLAALGDRGFDIEEVIRPIIVAMLSVSIVAFVSLQDSPFDDAQFRDVVSPEILDSYARWKELLRETPIEDSSNAAVSFLRVAKWIDALDFDELLAWRAPTPEQFALIDPEPGLTILPSELARWVSDRFSETYLDNWATTSLDLEWAYLHGSQIAPCKGDAMRTRQVTQADLALAIAHRKAGDSERSDHDVLAVSAFVSTALEHLQAGRRGLAAAIFDACRKAAPENAEAHNNYGFCLLPDDPAMALNALETAARLGMETSPVNVANRIFALLKLGRLGSALEVAESFAESGQGTQFGYLWNTVSDREPRVIPVNDVSEYIARLALEIAIQAGEETAAKTWRGRLDAS